MVEHYLLTNYGNGQFQIVSETAQAGSITLRLVTESTNNFKILVDLFKNTTGFTLEEIIPVNTEEDGSDMIEQGTERHTYGIYDAVQFSHIRFDANEGEFEVTFNLKTPIEATLEQLQREQRIQNNAIMELAELLGGE